MTKMQTELRVDRLTFQCFKELCNESGFSVGEIIEDFIKETLEIGDVVLKQMKQRLGSYSISLNLTARAKGEGVFRLELKRLHP